MNKKGFTLIELLVVIAIIGILASVILASLNAARSKARDARRLSDLNQMQTALEMYYDSNGKYPQDFYWCDSSKGVTATSCSGYVGDAWNTGGLIDLSVQGFMPTLPVDPLNDSTHFYYYEPVQNQTQFGVTCPATGACAYLIGTYLENPSNAQAKPGCMTTLPSMNYCVSGGNARFGA